MGGFADAADLYGGIGCFGLSGGTGGRNFPEAVRCGVLLYGGDGILGVDVEDTIRHVGVLAAQGMRETDRVILRIMTE